MLLEITGTCHAVLRASLGPAALTTLGLCWGRALVFEGLPPLPSCTRRALGTEGICKGEKYTQTSVSCTVSICPQLPPSLSRSRVDHRKQRAVSHIQLFPYGHRTPE